MECDLGELQEAPSLSHIPCRPHLCMCIRIPMSAVQLADAFACRGEALMAKGPAEIQACRHDVLHTAQHIVSWGLCIYWIFSTLAGTHYLMMWMRCRAHYPGECSASECSLMCNDFLRLNYSSIIIDPGVRLAYATDAAELPFAAHVVEAPVTSWADVLADPIDEAMAIKRPLYQCAPPAPAVP